MLILEQNMKNTLWNFVPIPIKILFCGILKLFIQILKTIVIFIRHEEQHSSLEKLQIFEILSLFR